MNEIKEPLSQPQTRVEIVYAGGTISSLATPKGYREGGHIVDLVGRLSERYPGFDQGYTLGEPEVAYTGLSENMDEDYWSSIKASVLRGLNNNPNAVIVTHGTDSMEQTARYLQRELGNLLKRKKAKIILTGANEDLSHPQTDAWDNLRFAFDSAKSDAPEGVYIAFHKRLIPADFVVKEPFNGKEMNFTSTIDEEYLEAKKHQEEYAEQVIGRLRTVLPLTDENSHVLEYPVNIVRANHNDFVNDVGDDVRAVLLTLYHSGTANTEKSGLSVAELVKQLREQRDIIFFGVTENGEPVSLHSYETSVKLREAGVVPLYDMPREVAAAKLQLVANGTGVEVIDEMLKNKVGEIDESQIIKQDIDQLKDMYTNHSSRNN